MRRLPITPRRADDGHLLEHNFGLTQRTCQGLAGERVEHRSGRQVIHHLVRPRQQPRSAEDNTVGALDIVSHVGLSGATKGAVGDAQIAAAKGGVHHLVNLHLVPRQCQRLTADNNAEDDPVVRVPATAGCIGGCRVIERRDAVAGPVVAQRSIVCDHSAPCDQAPIDAVVLVEECLPARLYRRVDLTFQIGVAFPCGHDPGDEIVEGPCEIDAVRDVIDPGELGGGPEKLIAIRSILIEPQQVGD